MICIKLDLYKKCIKNTRKVIIKIEITYSINIFIAILYLINLSTHQPNKKYLPMINNLCFLSLIIIYLLNATKENVNAIICVGSMVLFATMLNMGYIKQMLI